MNKWISFSQFRQLFIALFREIIREPGVLFWGILFPILMALGLGIAFARKPDVTRKIAIISSDEKNISTKGDSVISGFLENSCERNSTEKPGEWRWKYTIEDSKLGNSIFLFYQ